MNTGLCLKNNLFVGTKLFALLLLVLFSISGVYAAEISGIVKNNKGEVLDGVHVTAFQIITIGDAKYITEENEILTDSNGKYVFLNLPTGDYVMHYNHTSYASEYFENIVDVKLENNLDKATVIKLSSVDSNKIVNAVLEPRGVISGVIRNAQGEKVAGALVVVFFKFGDDWDFNDFYAVRKANDKGEFSVSAETDTYRICFDSPDGNIHECYKDSDNLLTATDIVVRPSEETTLNIVLGADDDSLPEVDLSVSVTDDLVTEINQNPGVFTIRRTGSTEFPLTVEFGLSGTAEPEKDYNVIGASGGSLSVEDSFHQKLSVEIPSGQQDVDVVIEPIDDNDTTEQDETVILTLIGYNPTGNQEKVRKRGNQRLINKIIGNPATIVIVNNANAQAIPTLQVSMLFFLGLGLLFVGINHKQFR